MKRLIFIMLFAGIVASCSKNEPIEMFNDAELLELEVKSVQNAEGDNACAELIYPVDYMMPDGTQITVYSEESAANLWLWYRENPGYDARPVLVFPVQMIFNEKTYTIENGRQLARIRAACGQTEQNEIENLEQALWRAAKLHLLDNGIESEKIDQVLNAMRRLLPQAKEQGQDFQFGDGAINHLANVVGLTRTQIVLVRRLLVRLANALSESDDDDGDGNVDVRRWNAVKQHLLDNGIEPEKIDQVLNVIKRVLPNVNTQGRTYQLNERVKNHLADVIGLTEEQIELVRRVLVRLANG